VAGDYAEEARYQQQAKEYYNSIGLNSKNPVYKYQPNLDLKGKPNSKGTLYNPDGSVKQERWYGPDGFPVLDRDYNHGGNHKFPHDHEWIEGVRQGHDPVTKEPELFWDWDPFQYYNPYDPFGLNETYDSGELIWLIPALVLYIISGGASPVPAF